MQDDTILVRGSYRYANAAALEAAIAAVTDQLDGEPEELGIDWLRLFVRIGTTMRVDATLPFVAYRFLSGGVVDALASGAIDGAIEATRGGKLVDLFPCGDDA